MDQILFQFINLVPTHDNRLTDKYQLLKRNALALEKVIKSFDGVIASFTKVHASLTECIKNFQEVQYSDAVTCVFTNFQAMILNLSQQLNGTTKSLQQYISYFSESTINNKRAYKEVHKKYNDYLEKYMANSKRCFPKKKRYKREHLVEFHKQASRSFIEHSEVLDMTENTLKKTLNVFCAEFIEAVRDSFVSDFAQSLGTISSFLNAQLKELMESLININNQYNNALVHADNVIETFWNTSEREDDNVSVDPMGGYLWVRTGRINRWTKTFVFLDNDMILGAASHENRKHILWSMKLISSNVKVVDDYSRDYCFQITNSDKKYVFQTPSVSERSSWVSFISNHIVNLYKCESEEIRRCCDCNASNANWLVINKGIVICDECAGVHRSFTCKVSKVRSIALDNIDEFTIQLFQALGNKKVNSLLAPPGSPVIIHNCSLEARKKYLTEKYIEMKFLRTSRLNPPLEALSSDLLKLLGCILSGEAQSFNMDSLNIIHIGAIMGDPLVVSLLALNYPEKINELDENGWTPLLYATYYGHFDVVRCLIIYNADATLGSINAYEIASYKQHVEIMEMLVYIRPDTPTEYSVIKPPFTKVKPKKRSEHKSDDDASSGPVAELYSADSNLRNGKLSDADSV